MTVRIIRESEVRDALRGEQEIAKSREHAQDQITALYQWCGLPEAQRKEWGGNQYLREIIGELEWALAAWPEPLTAADLA